MKKVLCLLALVLQGFVLAAEPPVYHATMGDAQEAIEQDVYDTERNREFTQFTIENGEKVKDYLGSSYAGTWTAYAEDGNMYQIIAITRPIRVDPSIFPRDYYRFVEARYGYDELMDLKKKLSDIFMTPGAPGFSLINLLATDFKKNKVEMELFPSNAERVQKIMRDFNINFDMVEMVLTWSFDELPILRVN